MDNSAGRSSLRPVDWLLWIAIASLVGCVLGTLSEPTLSLVAISLWIAAGLALTLLLPLDRRVVVASLGLVLALGWTWWTGLKLSPQIPTVATRVRGVIVDLPEGGAQPRAILRVDEPAALTGHQLRVTFPTGSEPRAAERLELVGSLGRRDTSARWRAYRLANHLSADLTDVTMLARHGIDTHWRRGPLRLRATLVERTKQLWPEPAASLAAGLILGSREDFDTTLTEAMTITGTTHLVAVSGYNVGIVTWIFGFIVPKRWRWVRVGWLLVGVAGFVLLTGATASVTRAGLASFVLLAASTLGRPVHLVRLLVILAALMALPTPAIVVGDLGFQLSFLAVFGLITYAPVLAGRVPIPIKFFRDALAATLAAYVMTAPLIASSFGRLSLIAPVSNVLVAGLVPFAMGTASVGLLLASVPGLGGLALWLSWPILAAITGLIRLTAAIPLASLSVVVPVAAALGATLLLVFGGILTDRRTRGRPESLSGSEAAGA